MLTLEIENDHSNFMINCLLVDLGVPTHHMSAGKRHAEQRLFIQQ